MKYVTVDALEPGMIVAQSVYSNDYRLLIATNSELTRTNINRIRKLGYEGIYTYAHNEKRDDYEQMLSDEIRLAALKNLKHLNIDACLYVANAITNEVLKNKDTMYELLSISSFDDRTYQHCINVAVLSVMVGIEMGMENDRLLDLSKAALLHDIGKTCIDTSIINKEDKLTDEEYALIKMHPKFGFELLKNNDNISSEIRLAIYSHHENEDGTGYPRGIAGDKIHIFAKIIHAVDVYDAMVSKRSYKGNINPADVLEYMYGNCGHMFNEAVIKTLSKCVALYPVGTTVELSNGETAIIRKNVRDFPTRPEVILENGDVVKLVEYQNLNITITALLTTND